MRKIIGIFLIIVIIAGMSACDKNNEQPVPTATEGSETIELSDIVATVNGEKVMRGEVEEYLYQMLGYYVSMMDETTLNDYRTQALDILIQQEAARQKAKEMNLYELTDEETEEINKSYDDYVASGIEYFTEELKAADETAGLSAAEIEAKDYTESAKQELISYLEESMKYMLEKYEGETVLEKYKSFSRDTYVVGKKLSDSVTADVTVEDTAVKEKYDTLLAAQKTAYDADVTAYEEAYSNNINNQLSYGYDSETITYIPEGLRFVKHILIMFPEDTIAELEELNTAVTTAKGDVDFYLGEIEDSEDDTTKAENEAKYKEAKITFNEAEDAYNTALNTASAGIKAKVDEVNAKVKNGEDFDKLIEEYSEDTGMEIEEYKKNGYLLSEATTGYYEIFTQTAIALEKVGDYSEPIYSMSGAHILKLSSIVESKELAYDTVKDNIKAALLAAAQSEKYYSYLEQWAAAAKVEKFTDKLTGSLETAETAAPGSTATIEPAAT